MGCADELPAQAASGDAPRSAGTGRGLEAAAWAPQGRFRIGACDWSLGMRARTDAFARGEAARARRRAGLDGSVDNDLQLRRPDVQRAYREPPQRPACGSAAWRWT